MIRRRPFLASLVPAALALRDPASAATAPPETTTAPAASTAESANAFTAASTPSPAVNPPLGVSRRTLHFPADHGSHPDTHVEWWYITGWLRTGSGADVPDPTGAHPPEFGFQVTFFRTRTGLAESSTSRFAARQLVFAHLALTDLAAGAGATGFLHDQRAAREGFGIVQTPAAAGEQRVQLRDWSLVRLAPASPADTRTRLQAKVRSDRFALDLTLDGTQAVLLQGEAGYSQKGPDPADASHYYSEPQLAVHGRLERSGASAHVVSGRAWLDHEWSDQYLGGEEIGWDWVGFNLHDGAALMAFRARRADGSAQWAGGAWRSADSRVRNFGAAEVRFEPLRRWTSPRTQAAYPVEWRLTTPAGRWRVVALRDDQELDSRQSVGAIYWEGLSALETEDGRTVGWGYLELTGYAGRLRL